MAQGQVTLLRLLVNERRLTREEVRRCLVQRAHQMQIDHFSIERRQIDRWLNGEVKRLPHPTACRVLEAEFGHPPEQLLAFVDRAPDTLDVRSLVTTAAAQSVEWGRQEDSRGLGPLALESLRIQVANLATDYVYRPMVPVVRDLISLRDELFNQLRQPHPGQAKQLYLLAGVTCAILGHASGNLGFLGAAHDQAQTAVICADRAEYPPLAAWAYGVRALQCEWNGRPREALGLVARALKALGTTSYRGSITAWLAAIEARAWARLGHRRAATESLATATDAAERIPDDGDELEAIGGIVNFPLTKHYYYAAVVSRRCHDLTRAEKYADQAVEGYVSGPAVARSYGDEALARVELAIARASGDRPDLDGAAAALRQTHDLLAHTRIAAVAEPLRELGQLLSLPRLRSVALAAQLRAEVRHLLGPRRSPAAHWTN